MSREYVFIKGAIKNWIAEHEGLAKNCRLKIATGKRGGLSPEELMSQVEFSENAVRECKEVLELISNESLAHVIESADFEKDMIEAMEIGETSDIDSEGNSYDIFLPSIAMDYVKAVLKKHFI